jgi:hypothetical protein
VSFFLLAGLIYRQELGHISSHSQTCLMVDDNLLFIKEVNIEVLVEKT